MYVCVLYVHAYHTNEHNTYATNSYIIHHTSYIIPWWTWWREAFVHATPLQVWFGLCNWSTINVQTTILTDGVYLHKIHNHTHTHTHAHTHAQTHTCTSKINKPSLHAQHITHTTQRGHTNTHTHTYARTTHAHLKTKHTNPTIL